jgi:nucleotidyltransferase substrate binding protein (TIGR01987 family)
MSKERFLERQANAKDSVSRLLEAVFLVKSEIVRDAVIQRFEFSYEAVWKALQIYLEYQGHECPGSRSVVRKAFAERFILTEEEADLWFQMIVDRNLTSHAYDVELSERIYANILSKYAALL